MIKRKVKNVIKKYSQAEILVREATSNDPWGPSSSMMSDISELTYNILALPEVMAMLWKRMNEKQSKNWRHVYKSLLLLDYLLKAGHKSVIKEARDSQHFVISLQDYQYYEEGKDLGVSIREKAKSVLTLLTNEEILYAERQQYLSTKAKFDNFPTALGSNQKARYGIGGKRSEFDCKNITDNSEKELEESVQVELALAMSKEELENQKKLEWDDEFRLKLALKESIRESTTTPKGTFLSKNNDASSSSAAGNSQRPPSALDILTQTIVDPWSGESKFEFDLYSNPISSIKNDNSKTGQMWSASRSEILPTKTSTNEIDPFSPKQYSLMNPDKVASNTSDDSFWDDISKTREEKPTAYKSNDVRSDSKAVDLNSKKIPNFLNCDAKLENIENLISFNAENLTKNSSSQVDKSTSVNWQTVKSTTNNPFMVGQQNSMNEIGVSSWSFSDTSSNRKSSNPFIS